MPGETLNLPRDKFEPVVSQPLELDALGTELSICFEDLEGPRKIDTCYGDVCKIVNALRDYARMLRMVCGEWDLQGCHRAVYELHADKLEEISKKCQAGIGYDYDKAVEKCRKKHGKKQRDSDVGGEAMAMSYLKAQRAAAAKDKSNPSNTPALSEDELTDLPMKAEQVEHYDIFEDDVITFLVDVSSIPQAMQAEARRIDGEHFDPSGFGVCVNYDFEQRLFYIVVDTEASAVRPSNVYYIDHAGDKHWFTAELPKTFVEQAFLACVHAVAHENCEIKPTEREAYQSAAWEVGCEEETL